MFHEAMLRSNQEHTLSAKHIVHWYQVSHLIILELKLVFSLSICNRCCQPRAPYKIDIEEMHMKNVFASMGSVLRILITLDAIIDQHPSLKDDWNAYKRMIKSVHHNPTKFQIDINKFYRFEKHLVELEGKLLDGTIYQVCCCNLLLLLLLMF